ncbi:unnamed protein product [Chrysoparadoxa australica]
MGNSAGVSRSASYQMTGKESYTVDMTNIEQNTGVVAHYMPPTFPLEAYLDPIMMMRCRTSWEKIMAGTADGMGSHAGKDGIVLYYDEFFFRLFKRARVFLDIFPDPAKRGEVLMKALGFMLKLEGDDGLVENKKIFYLGKSHRFKSQVRPWHFSVYVETALETLMFWLGGDADVETGEAWTCLVSYTLKRLLQAYLVDQVVPNEFYQNCEIEAMRKIMTQSNHSKINSLGESQHESQYGSQHGSQYNSQRGSQHGSAAPGQ